MEQSFLALVIAALAVIGTVVSLVISKEQKTSEFRQAWITELRTSLVQLLATYEVLKKDSVADVNDIKEAFKKINATSSEIYLRLNHGMPSEEEKKLREIITSLNVQVSAGTNSADLKLYFDAYTNASHAVLKKEWERVKRGEFGYRFFKFFSIIFMIFFLILCGIFLWHHYPQIWGYLIGSDTVVLTLSK